MSLPKQNIKTKLPKQNILLLLSVEVSKPCKAVMLVVGSTQFEWKCRRSTAGQQRLQVSLGCLLLLLQSLQSLGSSL